MAETYHIYDMKQFSPVYISILVRGLSVNSRVAIAESDKLVGLDTFMMASVLDELRVIIWQNTKDAQKGRNRPKSITQSLLRKNEKPKVTVYKTFDDFLEARERIMKGGTENGK